MRINKIPGDIMTDKITSVKIDVEKWEILKNKGYKLQNIVDNAFNNLLDIEAYDNKELTKIKADKEQELKSLIIKKKNMIAQYDKDIKSLTMEIKNINDKITENNELKIKEDEAQRIRKEKNKELYEIEKIVINGNSYMGIDDMKQNAEIVKYCEKYDTDVESLCREIINRSFR